MRAPMLVLKNVMCHFLLRLKGVSVGKGVKFHGYPLITMQRNSKIRLEDNVVLVSDSRYTALGVRNPIILRTLVNDAEIHIGANTGISGAVICAKKRVKIGENCLIGANVMVFDTDFHPIDPVNRRNISISSDAVASSAVNIGNNVFIGANATITKGVSIGDNSVIGTGSIVVNDIPSNVVASGNPCRVLRKIQ